MYCNCTGSNKTNIHSSKNNKSYKVNVPTIMSSKTYIVTEYDVAEIFSYIRFSNDVIKS